MSEIEEAFDKRRNELFGNCFKDEEYYNREMARNFSWFKAGWLACLHQHEAARESLHTVEGVDYGKLHDEWTKKPVKVVSYPIPDRVSAAPPEVSSEALVQARGTEVLADHCRELERILGWLLQLKQLKDAGGKTPFYIREKAKAWNAARQALDVQPLSEKSDDKSKHS